MLHSTSFHPHTDGQAKRTNQIFEDMLWAIVMEWQGSWDDHLDLVDGRCCSSPVYWENFTNAATLVPDLLLQMTERVKSIRDQMKANNDCQKSYADLKRQPEEFEVGDQSLKCIANVWGCSFWCLKKIMSWLIGLYEILERVGKMAYRLALLNSL